MKKRKKIDSWFNSDEHHKTVLKDFVTKRSHCADKRSHVKDAESRRFGEMMKSAERMLAFNRKHNYSKLSRAQYVKRLESEVVCHFMNYSSCLAQLVWLRGENAKLRGKLGIFRES